MLLQTQTHDDQHSLAAIAACTVANYNCLDTGNGVLIPTNGMLFTTINDYVRYNQFLARIDDSSSHGNDKIYGRFIYLWQLRLPPCGRFALLQIL